ncbi:MAG TPA: TonB family protein [Anaeromyxobacteraceae bacterium]|nr:TonB family protein [Anaeromyxobacteraceae bacterium]
MAFLGPMLRRRRLPSRPWRRALVALALSLLVNAVVLSEVHIDWLGKDGGAAVPRSVALAPLSARQWEANRTVGGKAAATAPRPEGHLLPAPPPAPAPPKVTPQAPGQVVDVEPSRNDAAPKDSRFVSERNNTVEKETRSRDARAGYKNTLARPSEPKAPTPKPQRLLEPLRKPAPQVAGQQGNPSAGGRSGAPAEAAKRAQEAQRKLALGEDPNGMLRLRPPAVGQEGRAGAAGGTTGAAGQAGAEGKGSEAGRPGRLDLHPSASTYDKLAGGPAPDKLEGVEEGEGTYLNTREWKYAGYLNRIKQAVANEWRPGDALATRDPTGRMYAYKDRITLVDVTLDRGGTLKDVRVHQSSGVDFLDRVAMDAFRKASPFVNPPAGMADEHGEIRFGFGFYLEVGSAGLRVFRQPLPGD